MPYQVIIYCPDQHILYDPANLELKGVGGGIMARIRLAQALVKLDHQVAIISNVTGNLTHQGVRYLPLSEATRSQKADVLVMTSSGGDLSLKAGLKLTIQTELREVWLHGITPIQGMDRLSYDYVVGASNFICDTVEENWGIHRSKLFSIYNGAAVLTSQWWKPQPPRDPHSLIYSSHPSKGLEAALEVLSLLRKEDKRFQLHVFGGNALWGGTDQAISAPGVVYHGTQGQQNVLKSLLRTNISLHLQTRLEPFGMVVTESMKHGSIPVASPVGAYNETIRNGYDGFLIPGDHESSDVHQQVAEVVAQLVHAPEYAGYIRSRAMQMPWTWNVQAKTWLQHWDWTLRKKGETLSTDTIFCYHCQGKWLLTADGYHCTVCGRYSRDGH